MKYMHLPVALIPRSLLGPVLQSDLCNPSHLAEPSCTALLAQGLDGGICTGLTVLPESLAFGGHT
jgi:hypothetical protein